MKDKCYTNLLGDFDDTKEAIVMPVIKHIPDFPEIVVMNFTHSIIEKWGNMKGSAVIAGLISANGRKPVFSRKYGGKKIAFCMADVGSPDCVAKME